MVRCDTVSGKGRIEREAELQAAVKRLEGFSSHVAHDLRDVLAGIAGLAEVGHAALSDRSDSAAALRSLQLISRQARRSIEILHGLLRLARTRDAALEIIRADVQAMAEQVAQELVAVHGAHGMPLVHARPMPAVAADADLLHAVLFNLIGNAVKFTRERSDACIEIDGIASDATVTVCVRDNGVGFDAASADLLFEPFIRLHGADYQGSGMGLSIVRQSVERLGGHVWADAAPGEGARFYFTLPLAADAGAPSRCNGLAERRAVERDGHVAPEAISGRGRLRGGGPTGSRS